MQVCTNLGRYGTIWYISCGHHIASIVKVIPSGFAVFENVYRNIPVLEKYSVKMPHSHRILILKATVRYLRRTTLKLQGQMMFL